jgi:hypothetical protein
MLSRGKALRSFDTFLWTHRGETLVHPTEKAEGGLALDEAKVASDRPGK